MNTRKPLATLETEEYTINVYPTKPTRFGTLYWADNDIAPRENPSRTAYRTIQQAMQAEHDHINSVIDFA